MIKSFKDEASLGVFEGRRPARFKGLDHELALVRLDMLDAAVSLQSISPLKSVGLHPLKGSRQGQWAVRVNGRWRICFRFAEGHVHQVEITDYHRG